jgi:hypothetical protein
VNLPLCPISRRDEGGLTFTLPSHFFREKGRTRAPLCPWSACPLYLQVDLEPPGPLRLQTFEQQSAFVVQEAPDGKHPASVVVVVLVVVVVVDDVVVELVVLVVVDVVVVGA